MTARDAVQKGYGYSGICNIGAHNRFEERRAEIKAAGYKTVIVTERVSRYSRSSPGMAYRVLYIENRYFIEERIKQLSGQLNSMEARRQRALAKYNEMLAEIDKEEAEMKAKLLELNSATA